MRPPAGDTGFPPTPFSSKKIDGSHFLPIFSRSVLLYGTCFANRAAVFTLSVFLVVTSVFVCHFESQESLGRCLSPDLVVGAGERDDICWSSCLCVCFCGRLSSCRFREASPLFTPRRIGVHIRSDHFLEGLSSAFARIKRQCCCIHRAAPANRTSRRSDL